MKKTIVQIIALIVLLCVYSGVNSQCVISPHTQPGFYPTSQHGVHPAAATAPYDLNITIVVPADTIVQPLPTPVPIDSIRVQSFIGFPAGFQYYYNTLTGWIKGGTSGCMRVYGTPALADVGTHSISIAYTVVIGGFAIPDTLKNYWEFEIKDDTQIAVDPSAEDIGNIALFPNPALDNLMIKGVSTGMSEISIYNASGKLVLCHETEMKDGVVQPVDISKLRSGLYFIRINHSMGSFTGKFFRGK